MCWFVLCEYCVEQYSYNNKFDLTYFIKNKIKTKLQQNTLLQITIKSDMSHLNIQIIIKF